MARLCERPGCSEPGAAAYGMVPEDLLFWIAPLDDAPVDDHNVLCRRHADAMVVPRGWTLDDRREPVPRLFMPRRAEPEEPAERPSRRRARPAPETVGEQLQIDGTGEIERPTLRGATDDGGVEDVTDDGGVEDVADDGGVEDVADVTGLAQPSSGLNEPWQPDFDTDDDLGGLLEVQSPLLARAFRGTGRPRS